MVDFLRHVTKVRELLVEKGLRAVVVTGSSNVHYLVGCDAPSAVVVFSDGDVITLSLRLEYTRTLDEAKCGTHYTYVKDGEVAEYENALRGDFYEAVKKLLEGVEDGKWGHAGLSQESRKRLEEKIGSSGVDLTSDFKAMRRRKEPSEVEALRSAARVAEGALARAVSMLERNLTEAEIAAEIVSYILKCGCQPSFPPIVAFGEHAAHPHATPSLRKLKRGDVVKVDLGARVEGYCSDLTRTLAFGDCDEKLRRALLAVLKAQEASIENLKPNVRASEIHRKALEVLKCENLSAYFNHGLGHGVGIDIHEEPYINADAETPLVIGDVVTVEPGVYIRGLFGLRIEDMVLVTGDGPEVLTSFPKLVEL